MNLYDFNSVSNALNQSFRKIFAQTVQVHQRRMYVALHSCAAVSSPETNIHTHSILTNIRSDHNHSSATLKIKLTRTRCAVGKTTLEKTKVRGEKHPSFSFYKYL